MENSKIGIESTRNLINGFEKRYGKILPLNYQQIKKDVKESDVWTDGGNVFVGLSVESGVDGDNLKVGQVNPNSAYIIFSSHINKSGVGDGEKPDVARTYSIHLEISGRKRYTQRTYADGTYYKVVNYGRTINDLLDKIKEGMEGLLILDSITPVLKLTYQGSNFKKGGRFDGVKPEYKALFKKYLKQEGGNQHTENALMIVKQFGTEKENERMVEIKNIHEKEGHLPYELYTERYEISQPHYGKMFYAKGGSTYAKGGAIEERVYAIDMRADMYEGEGFFTYNQFKRYADELSDDEFMDEAETQGLVWSSMDGYIMWNDTSEKVGVDNLVKRKIPVKMMVADEYVNPMLREEEEENGSDDLVDGLIEKLKNADLDGETLQYVLEKIGMDYQMYKQLNVKYDNEDEESELQKEGILKSIGGNKYKYKDFEFAVEDGQLDMTEPDYYEGQEIENDKPTLDEVKSVIADYFDFDNRDMTAFPLEKSESELITKNFNDREQKEIFGNTFAKGGSTSSFSKEDVMTVAQRLKLNPNKEQVKYVLDNMESQADSDPTGNWQTHIEDLLYEQGLNVFALYEQGVNNYAKGGYVWVEKDNIMELGDFEDKGEVAFMSSREVSEGIDEWNDQLDTNYTTIKEFNDGEEYRRIMTVKEFEVYKKDWIKDNAEFKNGGRVSRSDMEEWFYDHDNEWQNDIEIDHQQWMEVNGEMLHTNLDLVEWAYNRYHFAQGGKTEALYETGGKYANEPHDLIEEHKEQYKSKADFIKDIDETLVILKDPTYNTKVKDGWSHDKHQIAVLSVAKNILASNKYSKGGITIEGNPYKDEAIYIYRDGVEVVSWNEDEYDEDDNVKDLAKEMYDLYKKDKKELGKRLDSISYAKGGSTYTDGSGLEDPADDDCQRPNEDCECESQADCNCVECEKDIKNDLYGDEYSTSSFSKEDVMTVAQSLKLNPNKKQVKYVLDNMESQADSDPTGNWQTHIEDLLYEQGVKKYKKGGKTDSVDVGEAVFGLDKWLPDDDDAIREYQEIEDEGSVEDMIDYLNSYADEDRLYSKYGLTNSDFSAIAKKIMKKSYAKGGIVVRTKNASRGDIQELEEYLENKSWEVKKEEDEGSYMPKMIISTKNVSREEIGQLQDYLRGESWEYNDSNPGGSYEGIYAKGGKVPNKEQTREIANELIKQYKKMSKLSPSKRIKADKWELNEETLESGSFDIDLNDFMGDGGSYYISGDQVILASVTPQVPVYNWVEKASKGALLKAKEEELKK